jgi:hypothetical protein
MKHDEFPVAHSVIDHFFQFGAAPGLEPEQPMAGDFKLAHIPNKLHDLLGICVITKR